MRFETSPNPSATTPLCDSVQTGSGPLAFPFAIRSRLMSGHLVRPLGSPTPILVLLEQLGAAHAFLVEAARATVPRLLRLDPAGWGSSAKREHVVLPELGRPSIVPADIVRHSFAEVVNQCATLERLIDALVWAQACPDLAGALAVACNPTTSSARRANEGPRDDDDHDLVLRDASGVRWKFEVSDVASTKDGNGKEKNAWRSASSASRRNSSTSSRKRTPRCASDTSPGRARSPPPTRPAALTV